MDTVSLSLQAKLASLLMALINPASMGQYPANRTVGKRFQSLVTMLAVTLLVFGGLGSRLVYLQLVEGDHNRQLADNNRIRLIPKQPVRGTIFDRKGKILAGSRLSYGVYLWPLALKKNDLSHMFKRLAQILRIPETELKERLERAGYNSPYLLRIARGISPAQVTALEEYSDELTGVEIESEAVRYYPNGDLAAHILGYTGELNDEQLKQYEDKGYRPGDVIGQMGVERAFENQLRGEWGGQQVEVDGTGQVIKILGEKPSHAGQNIKLTLDLELQKAAEIALGDRKGAIVALDANTGAILAMVSHPAFDPNLFSTHINNTQWQHLQSADHPFINRALQGYPPASTFKVVTTTAGIESGKFSPDTVLGTYPSITVGGIEFADWNHAGFGPLGFVGALTLSSDTFFYQIGMGVGGPTLIQTARRYGFGRKTGIELAAEESPGLVPDEAWKQKELKDGWYMGDTVNMSIGQGYLQVTPLQLALMFAVPANGGYAVTPHLLEDNEVTRTWRQSLNLKPETLRVLREGLRGVVSEGTGTALNVPTIPAAAGKSGTAEDNDRPNHAWFGTYAPANKPQIVVVAFGENSGGHGGSLAGPMALQVLETFFNHKQPAKPAAAGQGSAD